MAASSSSPRHDRSYSRRCPPIRPPRRGAEQRLARVLSCHPVLTWYFDGMRDSHFGDGYADGWRMRNPGMDDGWIRRNDIANSLNSFNDGIPEKIASPPR
jgi:hypothetical protein